MSHEHHKDIDVKVAIITVSTSRTEKTDLSGQIIREAFEGAKMKVVAQRLVKDDKELIQKATEEVLGLVPCECAAPSNCPANCVVLTGGTGLTSDDCTIEAVTPMFRKTIDGFGEMFRLLSYDEVGTAAILSRAAAGLVQGAAVFCIPGSPKAVKLACEKIIVKEIKHILTHAGQ